MNSYDEIPAQRRFGLFQSFSPSDISYHMETLRSLKAKLKSLEDKSEYYESQIEKLNKKLKLAEKEPIPVFLNGGSHPSVKQEPEEDWKELFYEENEKKEKLENELDIAQQEIEYLQNELEKANRDTKKISPHEKLITTEELQVLHDTISELRNRLNKAHEESESLKEQLRNELNLRQQKEEQIHFLSGLKDENDNLLNQVSVLREKHQDLLAQHFNASGLNDKMQIYESKAAKLQEELAEASKKQEELNHRLQLEIEQKNALAMDAQILQSVRAENEELKNQIEQLAAVQARYDEKIRLQQLLEEKIKGADEEKARLFQTISDLKQEKSSLEDELKNEARIKSELQREAESLLPLKSENEELLRRMTDAVARQSVLEGKLALMSDVENKMRDTEQQIVKIRQTLLVAEEKNAELERLLRLESEQKEKFEEAATSLLVYKNENEGLRRQITEMASRQSEIEGRLLHLKELEIKVSRYEEEKSKMINGLQQMLNQSKFEDS